MSSTFTRKAVVLLSGGLDSTTCLYWAKKKGFDLYCLTFKYGQRHELEVEKSITIAKQVGVTEHKILNLPLNEIAQSSLTGYGTIPEGGIELDSDEIPTTYVPARNLIFLSIALSWAESIGAQNIFIGANEVDFSGYPDCRPHFLHAVEQVAELGTKHGVTQGPIKISAPLIALSKGDIIALARELNAPIELTLSCYQPRLSGEPCGVCDSCILRDRGMREYQSQKTL